MPACPHATFGADGNMGPISYMVDNPAALRYFAKLGRHVFALGPNATPHQVEAALKKDTSTNPIICSVYQLAAWRTGWSFRVDPMDGLGNLPPSWCPTPRALV